MRYRACQDLKLKEVPVVKAEGLTKEQKKEFIIKDNVSFGEWDWDALANDWDAADLPDWGLEVWQTEDDDIDYSILDDSDIESSLESMASGVKKAIQIEFEQEDYEKAQTLVKFWRDQEAYIGGMIIEMLKAEKDKL